MPNASQRYSADTTNSNRAELGDAAFDGFSKTLNGQAPGRESQYRMPEPVLFLSKDMDQCQGIVRKLRHDEHKLCWWKVCIMILAVFLGLNFLSCETGPNRLGESREVSVISADACEEKDYRHKTESELAAMTPSQRIEELAKEQLYHMPSFDEYGSVTLDRFIRTDGIQILPFLAKYLNDYDPKMASLCEKKRVYVAVSRSSDLDNLVTRLRGIKEGQAVIEAMQRTVDRIKGFCGTNTNCESSRLDFAESSLRAIRGTNLIDDSIRDTLWVKHKIGISDPELLQFSNFLTKLDPTYPSWSEKDFIKDDSRLNDAGNPLQVYVLKKPERFYEAYKEFKKSSPQVIH